MDARTPNHPIRFFPTSVDPLRYYPATSHEEARTLLHRVIDRCEGPAVVIGGAGLGKSMVCRRLALELRPTHRVIVLNAIRCSNRRELFQYALRELRRSYRGLDEAELRLGLLEELSRADSTAALVIILDEAHLLPLALLDDLRLLLNVEVAGTTRLQLILSGAGPLEEHLANPRLESLSQRLAARCYLQPIGRDEVDAYLEHHLRPAHLRLETIFDSRAIRAIYQAADGIPRLINQLADHSLVLQHTAGRFSLPLTEQDIQHAWADLQQLPTPWNVAPEQGTPEIEHTFEVELGPLDDDPFAAPSNELEFTCEPDSEETGEEPQEEPQIVKFGIAEPEPLHVPTCAGGPLQGTPIAGENPATGARASSPPAIDPFDEPFEEELPVDRPMRVIADARPSPVTEPAVSDETSDITATETAADNVAVDPVTRTLSDLYVVIDVAHTNDHQLPAPKLDHSRPLVNNEDIIVETW